MHIAVIHQAAIGDFVIALRACRAAMATMCVDRWTVVTRGELGRLAKTLAWADDVVDIDRRAWHRLFVSADNDDVSKISSIDASTASTLNGCDVVINMLAGAGSVVEENLQRIAGPQCRIVSVDVRCPPTYGKHVAEFLLAQMRTQIVNPMRPILMQRTMPTIDDSLATMAKRCEVNADARDEANRILAAAGVDATRLAIVHSGASAAGKRWAIEGFVAVADRLKTMGLVPVAILGEVEREQFSSLQTQTLCESMAILPTMSLSTLAGALAQSCVYIGNDNGITHLASAVGTKTIAVFVRDNAHQWQPIGESVRVIRVAGRRIECVVEEIVSGM